MFLLRSDGAALLHQRDDKPDLPHAGLWVPPGGHCEAGEAVEECARREFLEETNYRCGALHFLVRLDGVQDAGFPPVELFVFWGRYDGRQAFTCREGQALRFIERKDAVRLPIPDYLVRLWDLAMKASAGAEAGEVCESPHEPEAQAVHQEPKSE